MVALGVGDGVVVPTRNEPLDDDGDGGNDGDRAGVLRVGATCGPVDWLGNGAADGVGLDGCVAVGDGVGLGVGLGLGAVTVTRPVAVAEVPD